MIERMTFDVPPRLSQIECLMHRAPSGDLFGGGAWQVSVTTPGGSVSVTCRSWAEAWTVFKHLTDPYTQKRAPFQAAPILWEHPPLLLREQDV